MNRFYMIAASAALVLSVNAQQIPASMHTQKVTAVAVEGSAKVAKTMTPNIKFERANQVERDFNLPTVSRPAKAPAVAEEQTWVATDIKVTLTDDICGPLYGLDALTLEDIAVEESQETPGFYRLVDPYASYPEVSGYGMYESPCYMYLHTEYGENYIYFEEFMTGLTLVPVDGQLIALSDGGRYMEVLGGSYTPEQLAQLTNVQFGTMAGGNITFPANSLYVGVENEDGFYYANNSGKFCITFPGAKDYSFDLGCTELYNDSNVIPFTVSAGADIAEIRYLSQPGKYPASDGNLDVVASYGETLPAAGSYTLDYNAEAPGFVSVFAVGLDADGNRVAGAVDYFVVINHDYYTWKELGWGKYNDDLMSTYKMSPQLYDVLVEECVEKPGYYRIKNAFGSDSPYWEYNYYDGSEPDHYIYLDATDPEHVTLDFSVIGCILDEDGEIFVISAGAYNPGTTNAGAYGVLEDGVISFPTAKSIYMGFGNDLNGLYNSNANGEFALAIPIPTIVVLWNNSGKNFAQPCVHYSLDNGNTYEDEHIEMTLLEETSFAEEGGEEAPAGTTIFAASIPAEATHVRFSDGGDKTTLTNPYAAEDGNLYYESIEAGVETVAVSADKAEYFNLQGMRIDAPENGVYIVRQGGKVVKVVK